MSFETPAWLVAGLLSCIALLWLWRRHDARQRAALALFIAAHLRDELTRSISVGRRRAQRALFLAAVLLLCAALAGPLFGYRWEQISRRGNDIVFAIDTSRSMATPDVKPNRLARAKLAIDDFVNRLDGDAVGIVAFAGSAYLVCPITLDYGAFHESLDAVDTNTVPRGGTNISSAIREAAAALRRRPGSDKILILVTDGEDLEGSALAAAQAAKQQDGLKIYTVGVGTANGDLIPLPADAGGGFVKDESGQYVKSRLDESALKAIANATGGFYVPLGAQGEGLETISKTVLGGLAKHKLASRQQKIYLQRFQWPLGGALFALLSSMLIGTRRRQRVRVSAPAATPARAAGAGSRAAASAAASGAAVLTAALGTLCGAPAARAAAPTPEEIYNQGTQHYRAGQFPQAAQAFQQSISHAPSNDPKRLRDQEDAYYNLGNALYRDGQKSEQAAPQETLKKWNDAVKAYDTALQLRADDADSKYNRDLVKRKIAQLQQQQQQQQQSQNQKQNQNQKSQTSPQNGQGQGNDQPPQQAHSQPPPGQQPGSAQQTPQPPPQSPQTQPPSQQKPGGDQGDKTPRGAAEPSEGDSSGDEEAAARTADARHAPGEMSREEARELLDSVKGDERRPPGLPLAQRDEDTPQTPPAKNW